MENMTFGIDDFLDLSVFERLNVEFAQIAEIRRAAGRAVDVQLLDLSLGLGVVPTAEFINVIERHLDRLAGAVPPVGMGRTKVWLGEDRDEAWLDYRDVNRWFSSLTALRRA